jgi:hypothetical protein
MRCFAERSGAKYGRATAGANRIYCVIRGYFLWRETEEKISATSPCVFSIFFLLIVRVKNFSFWAKGRGARGEFHFKKHLICH